MAEADLGPAFILEREGQDIATLTGDAMSAAGLRPGHYQLKLDSGRMIWEAALSEQQLLWTSAHPGRPLEVAAESAERRERPTLEVALLEGELILRVYPGIEAGLLRLELRDPGAAQK